MRADDPRHGTEAGNEQHRRDGEEPCDWCHEARKIALRRRGKRRRSGWRYQLPLGRRLHAKLVEAKGAGLTQKTIAQRAGLHQSSVSMMLRGGPSGVILARTWAAIDQADLGSVVTETGIRRRLQGLIWLGYTQEHIARETGLCRDTIANTIAGHNRLATDNARDVVAAYDRLHMKPYRPTARYERVNATRARKMARERAYAPPLAWEDIDDPTEVASGVAGVVRPLPERDRLDEVAIQRRISGDKSVRLSMAEQDEAWRRWQAAGRSFNEFEKHTGISASRVRRRLEERAA